MDTMDDRRSPDHRTAMATEMSPPQRADAALFHELHHRPDVLVLANAWDAGSAALLAAVPGVRALATTSAGMAAAHGLPDGELLTLDHVLASVAQITRVVALPVSVDLEAGYGHSADEVADSVASVIDAGAVGVNLEDGALGRPDELVPANLHAARVAAARSAADQFSTRFVINARTDTYWRSVGPARQRLASTVDRLRQYVDVGADCVFVPGFPEPGLAPEQAADQIAELVDAMAGIPLNLLAGAAVPAVSDLAELGVRRLSVGSALYRLAMAAARNALADLLDGRQEALHAANDLDYGQLLDALSVAGGS